MKKSITFLILLLITASSFAQVRVGNFKTSKYKFKNLNKKSLERLKGKKAIFILPDAFSEDAYSKVLNDVWRITPFQILTYKNEEEKDILIDKYIEKDNFLAFFESYEIKKTTKMGMLVSYVFNLIDFHFIDKVKIKKEEKKWRRSRLASIYFTPDIEIRQEIESGMGEREINGQLLNYKLGYIKNYLQYINDLITTKESHNLYEDYSSEELKDLKNNTLYIDSNFLYSYNPFAISKKDEPSIEKLTKKYPYNYKVVDYKEIENKILDGSETFYYLTWN